MIDRRTAWTPTAPALILLLATCGSGSVAAESPDWRWPGFPTAAEEQCLAQPPAAALDVYADAFNAITGTHRFWDCSQFATPDRPLVAMVVSRLRFPKDLGFVLPTIDVEVDHLRRDFRLADGRIRVEAFSRGNAACRSLIDGECRLGFAPAGGGEANGWRLSRFEGTGPAITEAPGGTLPDDYWDVRITRADSVANFYTGLIWDVTPAPEGFPDPIQGRPATRYHVVSEDKGFPLFTSRFEHILWFDAHSRLLRVCDYQQDLGFSHIAELVRADLDIRPQFDCSQWYED